MFSFFNKISRIGGHVLGINERNASYVYPNNPRVYYPLADDKILTKETLEVHQIPCAKTLGIIERIGDIGKVWGEMRQYDKLAIKPANGSGGGGIMILRKQGEMNWEKGGKAISGDTIGRHMADIIMGVYSLGGKDRVLIETCIEPHPFFHEIYPAGVPDFRVVLLEDQPLLSMLRVPTDQSDGKANLHQGGLGIGIDMDKGRLTQGFDGRQYYDNHPDSGSQIFGKPIPQWEAIAAIALKTALVFPLDYLGVDIALDKDAGPLVMEINVRPGLGIQAVNKTGLKSILADL